MPKQKYLRQNGEIFYPITHTKSTYDNEGKVLEDRLKDDEKILNQKADSNHTHTAEEVGALPVNNYGNIISPIVVTSNEIGDPTQIIIGATESTIIEQNSRSNTPTGYDGEYLAIYNSDYIDIGNSTLMCGDYPMPIPLRSGASGSILMSTGLGNFPNWIPTFVTCTGTTNDRTVSSRAFLDTNESFSIETGMSIKVEFKHPINSSSPATFNLANSGAKVILAPSINNDGTLEYSTVTSANTWAAGEIIELLYNGTNWVAISSTGDFVHRNAVIEHEQKTAASDGGVHGVRITNGKIEIFDGRNFVEMQKAYKTYGVSIDLTNSDPALAVTYTDAAVGMIAGSSDWDNTNIFRDIRPCLFKNGEVKGYLNPNDFTKYIDGTAADISTGAEGDVMIEIPKLGVKIATSDNTLTVQVTDDPNAEGFSYLAHTREKSGDRDKLYIGAFLGYNLSSQLRSLCDKVPTSGNTIGQARTLAQANGDGYDQIAFYQLTLLQCLFLIKYKSRDAQSALGKGFTLSSLSSPIKTGGTIAKGIDFGETTGRQQMKFLGIEDFWGNLYYWIDGLVSSSDFHALTATTNFNDSGAGYNDLGQIAESDIFGYMKIPQGTNELGFIPQVGGASETTYFTDSANFKSGRVPYFGGYKDELETGAFKLYVGAQVSEKGSYCGGRLMYL